MACRRKGGEDRDCKVLSKEIEKKKHKGNVQNLRTIFKCGGKDLGEEQR